MPTKLPSTIPGIVQEQVLNMLITAAFTLHSGKDVLDFARELFETNTVEQAIEERRVDEKEVGTNGSYGEGYACTSLARAHALLAEQGEGENAEELKKVALGRFTKDVWEENMRAIQHGW